MFSQVSHFDHANLRSHVIDDDIESLMEENWEHLDVEYVGFGPLDLADVSAFIGRSIVEGFVPRTHRQVRAAEKKKNRPKRRAAAFARYERAWKLRYVGKALIERRFRLDLSKSCRKIMKEADEHFRVHIEEVLARKAAARKRRQRPWDMRIKQSHSRKTNTMTSAQRKMRGFGYGVPNAAILREQAGLEKSEDGPTEKEKARHVREVIQRKAAAARERAEEKKKFSKDERRKRILAQRDKRSPVFQSGKFYPALVGGAAALVVKKLYDTLTSIGKTSEAAGDLVKQVKAFGSQFKKVFGKVFWKVPIVMIFWYAINKFCGVDRAVVKTVKYTLRTVLGVSLWEAVANFFPDSDGVTDFRKPVNGEKDNITEQSGLMSSAASLLTVVTTFSAVKKGFGPREITELTKRVAAFDRTATGFESFFDWVLRAFEGLVNIFAGMFSEKKFKLFSDAHEPVKKWIRAVDSAFAAHNTARAPHSTEELRKLVQLVVDGNGFKSLYHGTSMVRAVDDAMVRAVNLLQPHLGALNAMNNFRAEPVCVMFLGDPGVGKTVISMPAAITALTKSGLIKGGNFEEAAAEIWQKGTSEFWNSYSNQLCVVMDDAFQARVNANNTDNEFMNIIRMVSSWSYPLNMADLASKGKIFFNSRLIFGTTNVPSIDSEARIVLQEPEAVARRINFGYKLLLKPEFAHLNGRLNTARFNAELELAQRECVGVHRFPWHMWEVSKHDFITGQTSSVREPLLNIILKMADELKLRNETYNTSEASLRDYVAGLSAPTPIVEQMGKTREEHVNKAWADICEAYYEQGFKKWKLNRWIWLKAISDCALFVAETVLILVLSRAFSVIMREAAKRLYIILKAVLHTLTMGAFKREKRKKSVDDSDSEEPSQPKLDDPYRDFTEGVNAAQQSNIPRMKRVTRKEQRNIISQSINDDVQKNVYANTYKLYYLDAIGKVRPIGQIIFIMDRLAVQPAHYTRRLQEAVNDGILSGETELYMMNARQHSYELRFTVSSYLALTRHREPDTDIEFLKFKDCRAHRNIMNNFIKEADIKYFNDRKATLEICDVSQAKDGKLVCSTRLWALKCVEMVNNLPLPIGVAKRAWSYISRTKNGDCGAPLCLLDNSLFSGRTCFGFHVAADERRGVGYSVVITREMIDPVVKAMGIVVDRFEEDIQERGIAFQCSDILPFSEAGSFLPIGMVDKPVTICPKSSLYKIESTYGMFGQCDDMPAPLRPVYRNDVLVYPMEKAVAPYSTPVLIYEQKWLPHAVFVGFQKVSELTKDCSRRLYTFEEAVLGIPEEKFRSLPRGTAAGYPYVLEHMAGKTAFFGTGDVYDLEGPRCEELRCRVNHILDSAARGERLSHVFVDFLKDELRSPAKVEAVKTRLISSAPVDYTIAWRMMFGAFSTAVMTYNIESGMAPGICAYTDWDLLAMHLQKKGDNVTDGDFEAFDASEQPSIHRLILDGVNRWYDDGPQNALIREVLMLDLFHSRHIGGLGSDQRFIYQWNKSLPSGHPFTTIVNSLYSLILLVGTYISSTGSLSGFWDDVSPITYGDDNVVNIHKRILDKYNQVEIARIMAKEFGVRYTPGNKSKEYVPFTTLNKVTFLKRSFRMENNAWCGPVERNSYLYVAYWGRNRKCERETLDSDFNMMLSEMSLHDAEEWRTYAPDVVCKMKELGLRFYAEPTRDAYRYFITHSSDLWY